jgi:hypothetical protein
MIKSILKSIFFISSSIGLAHGETAIGSNSVGKVKLPETFHHENEGRDTLFVMPRKDDMEGPISMRITTLRDLHRDNIPADKLDAAIKLMLLATDEDKELEEVEGKLVSLSNSKFKDSSGIEWILQHRSVHSEGIIFTITIGTMKGRETEPQCKELENKVNSIIATLGRKDTKTKN